MLDLDKQNEWREQYRQSKPGWRPSTELFAERVRGHLKPESLVLDLGCGRGGLVEQLAHPLSQVAGVDPDLVSLAEHRLPLPRSAAHSHHLPFAAATFDLVFASWVLEHLQRPSLDFQEISRVLRPAGLFVFITPNKNHPLIGLNHLLGRFNALQTRLVRWLYGRSAADTFPAYYRANTAATLTRLAQAAHMDLIELHPTPDPTYLAFTPTLFQIMCRLESFLPASRKLHLVGVLKKSLGSTVKREP